MTGLSDSTQTTSARILFQLSGSIAAYKACHVVSRLVQAGCEVQTVATRSALEFVGEATLEGLTGRPVATELFASGSHMDHIRLIRWADLVVLCPATANTINKLASGVGDDLLSTLFLAHDFDKPYLLAPAMNVSMYRHPATQRSLDLLRGWGVEILEPGSGSLACGEVGEGRLLEPDEILARLFDRLDQLGSTTPSTAGAADHFDGVDRVRSVAHSAVAGAHAAVAGGRSLRILVTSGGTAVPIDGVRSITNTSTGATGAQIAEDLAKTGHSITFVHARDSILPVPAFVVGATAAGRIASVPYTTFPELDEVLRHELGTGQFDAVIHLAAVSDFDVDHLVVDGKRIVPNPFGKIDSGDTVAIHLRKNHKILSRLKDYAEQGMLAGAPKRNDGASGELVVVGFKLTNGASAAERHEAVLRITPGTDLIVHNDLTEIDAERHLATIYRHGEPLRRVTGKAELARVLGELIDERVRGANAPETTS